MPTNPWSHLSTRCPQTTRLLVLPLFLLGLFGFLVNTDISFHPNVIEMCFPKTNVVFLKTHKCAGSSVQNILLRYGDEHGLNFVLPRAGNYLGHPLPFNRTMVAQPFLPHYNVLAHHTRLNYDEIRALMPLDSVYITIVRDPIEVFESSFSYYNFRAVVGGDIHRYLANVQFMKGDRLHRRIRDKFGTNQMMFDLGADPTIFPNDTLVRRYIDQLDDWFDLVLVADRMDESLVLLRHLMCWDVDHVVTFRHNARAPQFVSRLREDEKRRLRQINRADVLLYDHFLKKFDSAVEAFGRGRMADELRTLRERTQSWYELCVKGQERQQKPKGNSKVFFNPKVMVFEANSGKNSSCRSMTIVELLYTDQLRKRQMGDSRLGRKSAKGNKTGKLLPKTRGKLEIVATNHHR